MPLETSRHDSADYLVSEEAIAGFLAAALEEQFDTEAERAMFLAGIHETVERARARHKAVGQIMEYRGFRARVEYDKDDGILFGLLRGVRFNAGFHADEVEALRSAFHEAVDDLLETLERIGAEPLTEEEREWIDMKPVGREIG